LLVLVTDNGVYAMGFAALFADDRDAQPISVVTSPDACMHVLQRVIPDVVVVDCDTDGAVELCERVAAQSPGLPVLVLVTTISNTALHAAIDAGVVGFVSKRNEAEYVRNAVKTVAGGRSILDPKVTRSVFRA
jgi:DNA-binding NarL/FixJ family response regulator